MSEMIERVAKAVDAQVVLSKKTTAIKAGQIRTILDAVLWDEQNDAYRDECRLVGRAAIAAMREPTDEMARAAFPGSADTAADIWRAMIDVALKPKETAHV